MKITLRQAHKLINKINSRLATFQISAAQQVNIWEVESPAETFANLQGQFQALCARNVALVTARQTIRNQYLSEIFPVSSDDKGIIARQV